MESDFIKQGKIIKSAAIATADIEKVNQYSRRELNPDEVYCFNVRLCDNDVDRDYECFSIDTLNALAKLFIGKTGIFDHDPKGKNQTARIYSTEVITDNSRQTVYGKPYSSLIAKAYMVKSEKNADLILDIDAGIKKEVSVGCSVSQKTCSICGANLKETCCEHIRGQFYKQKLCYIILDSATDAYEWSFVAIPAQKNAGVIKAFNPPKEVKNLNESIEAIRKSFAETTCDITISQKDARTIATNLMALEKEADLGRAYRDELRQRVIKLSFLAGNEVNGEIFGSVVRKMDISELKAFENSYQKKLSLDNKGLDENNYGGQLPIKQNSVDSNKNDSFKI